MKKFLLFVLSMVVTIGAKATGEWSIDFAALGANYDDKTGVTISETVATIGGTTMGTCTVGSDALNENFVLQTGTTWLMRKASGLYQGNGGGRAMGMLACTKGQIITIVGTGDPNPSTNATLKSSSNGTYVYTVTDDGDVKFTPARYLYFTSITVENPSASAVAYTVKYVDGEGNELKKATEGSADAGSSIIVSEVEKAAIYTDGKKYVYASDDSEGLTVNADGTTVVTIKFTESEVYNYTVNFVAGDVTKSVNGKVFAGEAAKVYVPRYIFDEANKTLYSYKTAYEFNYTFTPASDNAVENLTFNAEETNSNAYFFSEAEDIEGVTPYEDGFTQIRMANGAVGIADSVAVAPLKPGIYTLTSSSRSGSTDFYVDGEKVFNLASTGAVVTETSAEFTVKENTNLFAKNVLNASNSNYFDYVLIRKTGDYKYLDVESTLPDTLKYVKGTPEDEKPKLSEYVKVSTNALKTVAAFYTTAKVEAGADKATAQYTAYETEDAAKAAMSEPGLYYCFGRIVGLFSMTDLNDYKEVFTDTIVVEVKEAEVEPVSAHTWDLTKWSEATINNLKAEAAKEVIADMGEGKTNVTSENGATWSDHEKAAQTEASKYCTTYAASKDNCFWFFGSANADGQLEANGQVIEELSGLTFPTDAYNKARSIAIAVNYGSTSLGTYAGGSYFWLGGKDKDCFVIKNVKAGSVITMGVESHKPAEARGVKLTLDGTELKDPDGNAVAAPTTYTEQKWQVPYPASALSAKGGALSADAGDEVFDITVHNTNGCHIYFIDAEIGEPTPDAIQTVEAETEAVKAVKFIKDGKLIIVSGGKQFNAAGAQVK